MLEREAEVFIWYFMDKKENPKWLQSFLNNDEESIVFSNRILYTPSYFARSNLLYLQEIGELKAQRPHSSSRSDLQSFLCFMVCAGTGSFLYEGKDYTLKEGDVVFLNCEKPYSHITSSDHLWVLRWVHFYGSNMTSIYDKYCERGGQPVFSPDDKDWYTSIWNNLMKLAASNDYIRDMKINAELNELLVLIMAESWHPESQEDLPRKKSLLTPIKEYLDANFGLKISLEDLASRFYINKYYLTKIFKEQYGQSISLYLLNIRITYAKKLLRFSDKSIKDVGIECGFSTAHYFSAKFKETEGISPSDYRRQWAQTKAIQL